MPALIYNEALALQIITRHADGENIEDIAKTLKIDRSSIYKWISKTDRFKVGDDSFAELMREAGEQYADGDRKKAMDISWYQYQTIKELLDNAEDKEKQRLASCLVQASRQLVDAIKWANMSRDPSKYGNKAQVEHTGSKVNPVTVQLIDYSKV